jgi:hypothetical protein
MTDGTPNRYPSRCTFCGSRVPAGGGAWSRDHGVRHQPGDCNTSTKTYRESVLQQSMSDMKAAVAAVYADAGYARWDSHRVEAASRLTGHGLVALVGGYKAGKVSAEGVRVFSDPDGELLFECPVPRVETGDYCANQVASARALVYLLDSLR